MKEEQNKNKIITNKTKWRKKYNRVTHKEWDCKDDLKLFTYDDYKVKLSLLPLIWPFNGFFNDLAKTETNVKLQTNMYIEKWTL